MPSAGRRILYSTLAVLGAVWLGQLVAFPAEGSSAQTTSSPPAAQKPAAPPASASQPAAGEPNKGPFYIHAFHLGQLGLDCDACHVPVKDGSPVLARPGHDQCMACHQDAFGDNLNPKICAECHNDFPPTGSDDLKPYPRYKGQRPLLIDFSHAKHVDPHGRMNPHTGLRADCTFCHSVAPSGGLLSPGHSQCASCHSQAGMKPLLSANSTTADCRGCHNPEQIENPVATPHATPIPSWVVSGHYPEKIKFSHATHLKYGTGYHAECMTCHYAVPMSGHLADLTLPRMADCASCHQASSGMRVGDRMTNCQTCHEAQSTGPEPVIYSRLVKPPSHTESFRANHAAAAAAPGADCFACHTNVKPSSIGGAQCLSCHTVMMPASHTARWRDDIHGKYAALDRKSCALCHTADSCVRCHNELPRSHVPLSLFKTSAHARLAMLNERSCLTCHTFENTCAECHVRNLR